MNNTAIKVENLTMEFRTTSERIDSLKEFVIRAAHGNIKYHKFKALDDISFEIKKGERIGMVGHNGAGKSTIMKIIAGVMKPTYGNVSVLGSVAPLLELGAGFDIQCSGEENIFLNAAILGKQKEYIEEKYDQIVEFAELGDFLYAPVKNYSSGMRAKLGFSIATQVEPDILIIDEILGVGDVNFKEKSSQRMREMINGGTTALIVSHNLKQIKALTEKTIWLDHGKLIDYGPTKQVVKDYYKFMVEKRGNKTLVKKEDAWNPKDTEDELY